MRERRFGDLWDLEGIGKEEWIVGNSYAPLDVISPRTNLSWIPTVVERLFSCQIHTYVRFEFSRDISFFNSASSLFPPRGNLWINLFEFSKSIPPKKASTQFTSARVLLFHYLFKYSSSYKYVRTYLQRHQRGEIVIATVHRKCFFTIKRAPQQNSLISGT